MLSLYQTAIFLTRYARYLPNKESRESFSEAVFDRYRDSFWMAQPCVYNHPEVQSRLKEFCERMYQLDVMPSMRSFMSAGPALERDNMCAYNCAAVTISCPAAFVEVMRALMCGTGMGYSIEKKYVDQLPVVPDQLTITDDVIVVQDSREGWGDSYLHLLDCLFSGNLPSWDLSSIREKGAPLITMGGTASGPEPLERLFKYVVQCFLTASGRRLTPIECHDILCMTADIVVVGGVRRSAMISLSDRADADIRDCKNFLFEPCPNTGELSPKFRQMANNSAVYYERPTEAEYWQDWQALRDSGTGERGTFNVPAVQSKAAMYRGRDFEKVILCNPCSEATLRDMGCCNLSEVVVRPDDSVGDLIEKVKLATFIGTLQSTLTNFPKMRKEWVTNAEEERLLGVSLTGICSHPILSGKEGIPQLRALLEILRLTASNTNNYWADHIGINRSVAITTMKPSGTVSALTGTSSGIHSWFSSFFERRIEMANRDPMTEVMKRGGIPWEPKQSDPENSTIFVFPTAAPADSEVGGDLTAIQQLERVQAYEECWAHMKVSATVYVNGDEWEEVGQYMWDNFDNMPGVSFYPSDENPEHLKAKYIQPPYTKISEEDYRTKALKMPIGHEFDWALREDGRHVGGTRTVACAGGLCEL